MNSLAKNQKKIPCKDSAWVSFCYSELLYLWAWEDCPAWNQLQHLEIENFFFFKLVLKYHKIYLLSQPTSEFCASVFAIYYSILVLENDHRRGLRTQVKPRAVPELRALPRDRIVCITLRSFKDSRTCGRRNPLITIAEICRDYLD